MNTIEIGIVALIMAVGWFWYDSMSAWEAGVQAARAACRAEGLQLLDETIAFASIRPRRDRSGRLCWLRIYHFEYSETGENRRHGSLHLLGRDLVFLGLGPRPVAGNALN
jgi:hypothetical protein